MAFNFVIQAAIAVGSLVLSIALAPKPPKSNNSPQELQRPTSEEGRAIPVVFGTVDIREPFVADFGDRSVKPIKKKGGKK